MNHKYPYLTMSDACAEGSHHSRNTQPPAERVALTECRRPVTLPNCEGAVHEVSDYASALAEGPSTGRRHSVKVGGKSGRRAGVKDFIWYDIAQRLVRTHGIVLMDIRANTENRTISV